MRTPSATWLWLWVSRKVAVITEHADRLTNISKEHETALAALRADAERIAAEALAEKEASLAKLKNEHEQTLAESVQAREQAVAQISAERDSLAREKEAVITEHADRLDEYPRKSIPRTALAALRPDAERLAAEALAEKESSLAKLKNEHEQALAESVQAWEKAVCCTPDTAGVGDGLAREKEAVIAEHADRLTNISNEHEAALAALRADSERIAAEALAEKEASLAKLKKSERHEQIALAERVRAREQAVAQITAARDGLAREKEAVITEHADRLTNISKEHEAALAALRADAERIAAERPWQEKEA